MLDSRYLYLHQALGLGPMWLSNRAHVIPISVKPTHDETATTDPVTTTINKTTAAEVVRPIAHQSHNTVSVISSLSTTANTITTATTETALIHSKEVAANVIGIETFDLADLPQLLHECTRCDLHQERTRPITGHGNIRPRLMIISTNPALEDDSNQQLFSGQCGLLLHNMLTAIGLTDKDVFYTTQVKCAPNLSLNVKDEQLQTCLPYLSQQIKVMQPQAILLLGHRFNKMNQSMLADSLHHNPYVIIQHPARLLSQSHLKAKAWQTLQILRGYLN